MSRRPRRNAHKICARNRHLPIIYWLSHGLLAAPRRVAEEEAVVQLNGVGPWEIKYVNPADDPRKKTQ
jgi:hypothetical protein